MRARGAVRVVAVAVASAVDVVVASVLCVARGVVRVFVDVVVVVVHAVASVLCVPRGAVKVVVDVVVAVHAVDSFYVLLEVQSK